MKLVEVVKLQVKSSEGRRAAKVGGLGPEGTEGGWPPVSLLDYLLYDGHGKEYRVRPA